LYQTQIISRLFENHSETQATILLIIDLVVPHKALAESLFLETTRVFSSLTTEISFEKTKFNVHFFHLIITSFQLILASTSEVNTIGIFHIRHVSLSLVKKFLISSPEGMEHIIYCAYKDLLWHINLGMKFIA